MHASYQPIVDALTRLGDALIAGTKESRSYLETTGWNAVAADAGDLAVMADELRKWIETNAPDVPDQEQGEFDVAEIEKRIDLVRTNSVPYLFNGNQAGAAPAVILSLYSIKAWLSSEWPEREVVGQAHLPARIARQARNAKARLDAVDADIEGIAEKMKAIADAHAAAEDVPTDLEELKELRSSLLTTTAKAKAESDSVSTALTKSESIISRMEKSEKKVADLIAKCEDAYQITTTKGLSAAFAQRASRLGASMWVWVVGLLGALISVAYIGQDRIHALTALMTDDPKWGIVTLNLLLSALSVGAPLWFSWVATKQIGQRFRLAEDYGFKAAVAKAYEGYRREALRIDPAFEKQLFSIALTRLEEAPLRMVETDNHGSPYHEAFSNLKSDPKFGVDLMAWLKSRKPSLAKTPSDSKEESAAS